jgi:hypothetical protein
MYILRTLLFTVILISAQAFAQSSTWYESFYKSSKLERKYLHVQSKINDHDFREIFQKKNLSCEPIVIQKLLPVGVRNVKFALLLANHRGLIDEVETDILLAYLNYLKSSVGVGELEIKSGNKTIKHYYQKMFNSPTCITEEWKEFTEKVNIATEDENANALSSLNQYAYGRGYITREQLRILEMVNLYQKNLGSSLTIKDYYQKQGQLRENGYEINSKIMSFHNAIRKKNTPSSRYNVYSNFSILQMKEMIILLKRLNERSQSGSSEILFINNTGEVRETISLNHVEQLRLSLKLYKKEKNELLLKQYFKGTHFSYRDLITLAYEVGEIDDNELEAFARLETKTKEKTFWQKATKFATKLDFLAASLGGPIVGVGYSLTISLIDSLVNKKEKPKAQYEHDIFYGNCEMQL